jgi:hypothetical protein
MAFSIRQVEYFNATVRDQPGEAYKFLSQLAGLGLSLVAFTAVPVGPTHTQLTLFPEDSPRLMSAAQRAGLRLDGPYTAFLVQGDDELGSLVEIHQKLYRANVNVYASSGVTSGSGTFGYLIYVRPEDCRRGAEALGI